MRLARVLCLNTFVNHSNSRSTSSSRTWQSARIITTYVPRNVRLFAQRNARARLRHLLFRRNAENRAGSVGWKKKREREKESARATAFPRDRTEKEKPEIDMYSMLRRVQSIAGQAGRILSAVWRMRVYVRAAGVEIAPRQWNCAKHSGRPAPRLTSSNSGTYEGIKYPDILYRANTCVFDTCAYARALLSIVQRGGARPRCPTRVGRRSSLENWISSLRVRRMKYADSWKICV